MNSFKVFKLTGIACKSQLVSCSSAEPDAWISFADHCQEVAFLKMEIERLKNNIAYLDTKLDEELDKKHL